MIDLEEKERINRLYDVYQNILTPKQKEYFKNYYFDDFSLGEIANNLNISRNAVYDQIKKTVLILENTEKKLGIIKKIDELREKIDEIEKKENINLDELKKIIWW